MPSGSKWGSYAHVVLSSTPSLAVSTVPRVSCLRSSSIGKHLGLIRLFLACFAGRSF